MDRLLLDEGQVDLVFHPLEEVSSRSAELAGGVDPHWTAGDLWAFQLFLPWLRFASLGLQGQGLTGSGCSSATWPMGGHWRGGEPASANASSVVRAVGEIRM